MYTCTIVYANRWVKRVMLFMPTIHSDGNVAHCTHTPVLPTECASMGEWWVVGGGWWNRNSIRVFVFCAFSCQLTTQTFELISFLDSFVLARLTLVQIKPLTLCPWVVVAAALPLTVLALLGIGVVTDCNWRGEKGARSKKERVTPHSLPSNVHWQKRPSWYQMRRSN